MQWQDGKDRTTDQNRKKCFPIGADRIAWTFRAEDNVFKYHPCPFLCNFFFFFLFKSSSQRQSQKSNKLQVGRLVWTLFLVRLFFILITWLFNDFITYPTPGYHSSSSKVWRSDKEEKGESSQRRKLVQKLEKQTGEKVSLWEVLGKAGSGKLKTERQIPYFPWENAGKTASLSLQTPTQPGQGKVIQ